MKRNDEKMANYILKVLVIVLAVHGAFTLSIHDYDLVTQSIDKYIDGRVHSQIWDLRSEMYDNLRALHPSRVQCGHRGCSVTEASR